MRRPKTSSSRFLLLLFTVTLSAASLSKAATITIINLDGAGEGFNDPTAATPVGGNTGTTVGQQRLNVFQRVAEIWGAKISSTVPILVGASFDALSCTPTSATLGSAGAVAAFRDFAGAPVANTWYPSALANALAGVDLDPGNDDIRAQFNSNIGTAGCLTSLSWYYGLDGNPPSGTIELLDTVLHEVGHGLGFQSFVNLSTGAKLSGFDDTFMRNLEDHSTGKTYPMMTDAERVTASKDTGDLHWIGANVVANSGLLASGRGANGHVEMYAPNPSQPGSSVSHFSTSLSPDELMEPFANPTSDRTLTSFLMKDIGWSITPEVPLIQPAGSTINSESCTAVNSAIDPDETVTVNFSLRNVGVADTASLVATLQASGGVTSPSGPQTYGALVAGGASVTKPFTFTASGTCGGTLTAVLQLQDGAISLGTITNTFTLGSAPPATNLFSNTGAITIPNVGSATPYPSTISVSGLIGTVTKVTVTLTNLTHTFPDDIDVLLVSPTGLEVLLMSDAGGAFNLMDVTLTFDDSAVLELADSDQLVSGAVKPTNHDTTTDGFAAPAPVSPYAATLSAFNGSSPNGTWSLYVRDDSTPDHGSIADGWRLTIVTVPTAVCCSPPPTLVVSSTSLDVPEGGTSNYTVRLSAQPATTVTVTNAFAGGDSSLSISAGVNLTFTTANWSNAQPVTLSAGNDADTINGVATFTVSGAGLSTVMVTATEIDNDLLNLVVGRWVFYNNSAWDGNNPAANANDDAAIATDKTALLRGGIAAFTNYTSYSRGINGIMVDIAAPVGTLSAGDFDFKVGNDNTPGNWSNAPAPSSITVRSGAGTNGSDRITIIWADNAIQKQWLEVTVKATANTGLTADDVFYFGNAVGETGNSAGNAVVNGIDEARVRSNPRTSSNPAPIDFLFDINRDRFVNALDEAKVRLNGTTSSTALKLIDLTALSSILAGDHVKVVRAASVQGQTNSSGSGLLRIERNVDGTLTIIANAPNARLQQSRGFSGPWEAMPSANDGVGRWRVRPDDLAKLFRFFRE